MNFMIGKNLMEMIEKCPTRVAALVIFALAALGALVLRGN